MKLLILIITLLFVGCSQLNNQTTTPTTTQDLKIGTSTVDDILKSKPEWLFSGDACPRDVLPSAEKEIKYLSEACADNPEICLNDCQKDDGNACYALALYLQESRGAKNENAEALFLRSCKLGILSGCTNSAAGIFDLNSKDSNRNVCAADTFEKTCKRDDPWGCTMFGMALFTGIGREKNLEKAKIALKKACQRYGENDEACQNAHNLEKQIRDVR